MSKFCTPSMILIRPEAITGAVTTLHRQKLYASSALAGGCLRTLVVAAGLGCMGIALVPQQVAAQVICGTSATGAGTMSGAGATATGSFALACGIGAIANGGNSTAISSANANGTEATAVGYTAKANGTFSSAYGADAFANGSQATATGASR